MTEEEKLNETSALEAKIKLGNALEKLEKFPEFKIVFGEETIKDKIFNEVNKSLIYPNIREEALSNAQRYAFILNYFNLIKLEKDSATESLHTLNSEIFKEN